MNAKEYLKEKLKEQDYTYHTRNSELMGYPIALWAEWIEEYHQHKLSEITEEDFEALLAGELMGYSDEGSICICPDCIVELTEHLAKAITNLLKGER